MNQKPRIHIPQPTARPGEDPDFSYLRLSPAGAVDRPPSDARAADVEFLAREMVRVLDEEHAAQGPWAPDLAADLPTQEERVLREERIELLLNANRELKPADQEVLSMRYGAGLSNQEIAEALGISNNAVAVRVHRALARLKDVVAAQRNT